ncbi:G protein-coupled glucose receptor regulating Gpa2-domain-containing protein [Chaetomium sp. MPI-SDFR-AT-0129]|nr:G protein-coupled glucose receptor regulating Gpa2-domain-containing protein [Chaetomium sp. MPI-SDFR-AT-0129]
MEHQPQQQQQQRQEQQQGQQQEQQKHDTYIIRVLLILSVTFASVSVLATLTTLYWFVRMRRSFRHELVLLLIKSDFLKSAVLVLFAIVNLVRGTVHSDSAFCQVTGFALAVGIETSDIAVLLIAVHSLMYIFRPRSGLYPYRRFAFVVFYLYPLLAASLAFINGNGYENMGPYCYLRTDRSWARLALSWVPRYMITVAIVIIYAFIYLYIRKRMGDFGRRRSEAIHSRGEGRGGGSGGRRGSRRDSNRTGSVYNGLIPSSMCSRRTSATDTIAAAKDRPRPASSLAPTRPTSVDAPDPFIKWDWSGFEARQTPRKPADDTGDLIAPNSPNSPTFLSPPAAAHTHTHTNSRAHRPIIMTIGPSATPTEDETEEDDLGELRPTERRRTFSLQSRRSVPEHRHSIPLTSRSFSLDTAMTAASTADTLLPSAADTTADTATIGTTTEVDADAPDSCPILPSSPPACLITLTPPGGKHTTTTTTNPNPTPVSRSHSYSHRHSQTTTPHDSSDYPDSRTASHSHYHYHYASHGSYSYHYSSYGSYDHTAEDDAPVRTKNHKKTLRQLRSLFAYPLVYVCVWLFPFISHILGYDDDSVRHVHESQIYPAAGTGTATGTGAGYGVGAGSGFSGGKELRGLAAGLAGGLVGASGDEPLTQEPPHWLLIVTLLSLCVQGAVDCGLFMARETPWRYERVQSQEIPAEQAQQRQGQQSQQQGQGQHGQEGQQAQQRGGQNGCPLSEGRVMVGTFWNGLKRRWGWRAQQGWGRWCAWWEWVGGWLWVVVSLVAGRRNNNNHQNGNITTTDTGTGTGRIGTATTGDTRPWDRRRVGRSGAVGRTREEMLVDGRLARQRREGEVEDERERRRMRGMGNTGRGTATVGREREWWEAYERDGVVGEYDSDF